MNDMLQGMLGKFVLVYLDDMIVFSKTEEEHLMHLDMVMRVLQKHKLFAKCSFAQTELLFLGQIVGRDGVRVDPKKASVVKDWPVPTNRLQVLSCLGFADYFRKFIIGFDALVQPLHRISKESVQYDWSAECQKSFYGVKDVLCNAPVLALPDPSKHFEVVCDACKEGIGAVLLQKGRPIVFEGKALTDAEPRYHSSEQELLAVVHALELWRFYLQGPELTVVTDHSPNTFFKSKKTLSLRQGRWAENFQSTSSYGNTDLNG